MNYEWDEDKNNANLVKHGIDCPAAIRIFDSVVLEHRDDRHNYEELRMIAIGTIDGLEFTVVYTLRENARRIISTRRSHPNERKSYRARLAS
jgi:uncharacterized DUF497 family protein